MWWGVTVFAAVARALALGAVEGGGEGEEAGGGAGGERDEVVLAAAGGAGGGGVEAELVEAVQAELVGAGTGVEGEVGGIQRLHAQGTGERGGWGRGGGEEVVAQVQLVAWPMLLLVRRSRA